MKGKCESAGVTIVRAGDIRGVVAPVIAGQVFDLNEMFELMARAGGVRRASSWSHLAPTHACAPMQPPARPGAALVVIDVQNDFCPGGALAVPGGDEVVPVINSLRTAIPWDLVALTKDFHPRGARLALPPPRADCLTRADHISFSSNNPGTKPFETITLARIGEQTMWPDHCVQGTRGCEFRDDLHRSAPDVVVCKGTNRLVDSYSGFGDAFHGRYERTRLELDLRAAAIRKLVVCGLATDYCVAYTALDAVRLGFETWCVLDACRGIAPATVEAAVAKMRAAGVKLIASADVASVLADA